MSRRSRVCATTLSSVQNLHHRTLSISLVEVPESQRDKNCVLWVWLMDSVTNCAEEEANVSAGPTAEGNGFLLPCLVCTWSNCCASMMILELSFRYDSGHVSSEAVSCDASTQHRSDVTIRAKKGWTTTETFQCARLCKMMQSPPTHAACVCDLQSVRRTVMHVLISKSNVLNAPLRTRTAANSEPFAKGPENAYFEQKQSHSSRASVHVISKFGHGVGGALIHGRLSH